MSETRPPVPPSPEGTPTPSPVPAPGVPGTSGSGDAAAPPIPPGKTLDTAIEQELADSYLTYAMSTIMDRALPDVRDGLKPSQRRILVAMHDLNLSPGRKHSKCAGIVGETMKKYHPHGDQAIYPTLVNMAQEWKTRYILIDKQGNFGSIDPDPPAAMRYTEARLHAHATEMLQDLDLDTVEWQPNFDETVHEPKVLPAKFPNLLVNGSTGIAVGMASSMAPHNLAEVCDAIIAVLDNPALGLLDLLKIIPGPDFPTGGIICGRRGIAEAYATGRGRLVLRARLHHEQKGARNLIVITQIPYQVSKNAGIIEKLVECRKEERITDISDVIDESSNRVGMRLVIELKKGADPNVVENQLYDLTPLQSTFSIINIALVNGQPRTLPLRDLLDLYIDHRVTVIRRRTAHRLRKAQQEAHRIEGLIYAVCDIDEVIRLIRSSKTREEAIDKLMARGFRIPPDHPHAPKIPARFLAASAQNDVRLTRIQAEAIGRLQLIQLVGLEIDRLTDEYSKLLAQIEEYESILNSEERVRRIIHDETIELKAKYGDPRRTTFADAVEEFDIGALTPVEQVVVTISHAGYVKRLPADQYRTQGRGGRGVIGADIKEDDFTEQLFVASTHDDLLCFTNTGRVYKIKVYEIPEAPRTSRGRAVVNLLELKGGERVCTFMPIENFEKGEVFLCFATANGTVKRTALADYRNVNRSGIIALNLREGDSLIDVCWTSGDDHLLLGTRLGQAIRFHEDDARAMGRGASGVKGITLYGRTNGGSADAAENGDDATGTDAASAGGTNGTSSGTGGGAGTGTTAGTAGTGGTGGAGNTGAAGSAATAPASSTTSGPAATPGGASSSDADAVIGLVCVEPTDARDLLTVTAHGFGKRTPLAEYLVKLEDGTTRVQSRGGKGRIGMDITPKTGPLVALLKVEPEDDLMLISTRGMIVRIKAGTVRQTGRPAQGVKVIDLVEGDTLAGVARIAEDGNGDEAEKPVERGA